MSKVYKQVNFVAGVSGAAFGGGGGGGGNKKKKKKSTQVGCNYVGVKELGALAAGTGAMGLAGGAAATSSSAVATVSAVGASVLTVAAVGGWNIGVAFNQATGVCDI